MHTNTTDRRAAIARAACAVVRLARLPELHEPANSHNAIVNDTRLYDDAEAWDSVVALEYMVSSHQLENTPAVITSRDLWISHARECGITNPTGKPLADLANAYTHTHTARLIAGRDGRQARNAEEIRAATAESNRLAAALAWLEAALEAKGPTSTATATKATAASTAQTGTSLPGSEPDRPPRTPRPRTQQTGHQQP